MPRLFTLDRLLITASIGWLLVLVREPALVRTENAYRVTIGFIAVNAFVCLWFLTWNRRVLIVLNCIQIVLFGTLNYQLYSAYGESHYLFEREPRLIDWVEFTAGHVLRAADFFHALGEYGINIQNITHNSMPAGILLVCMHVAVDVFLIGLIIRWAGHFWRRAPRGTELARERRVCAWLLITIALYLGFAAWQILEPNDWLLWPLDNLLRLLDIGDVFQIFHWRLHRVDRNFWTSTAAVTFRLAAGIWLSKIVILSRLTIFKTWGLSIDELTELLADGTTRERRGAAKGLGWGGQGSDGVVSALIGALTDSDPEVRCHAARALGKFGPAAEEAVEDLARALWKEDKRLSLEAARALGRIGPNATPAIRDLCWLWKVSDKKMQRVVTQALRKIVPEIAWRTEHFQGV